MKNTLVAATVAAGLGLGISPASAQTTVEFWHSFGGSQGEALNKIIAEFEAANPDIKVAAEHVGNYDAIVTRLQAAIPARRAPDAVIMEVTRYGLFADRGVLTDLTAKFDADPLKADLFDYVLEVGVYQEKTYIVPFNSSTPVMYINADLFERAGLSKDTSLKTFDEVLAAAQTVQEKLGSEGIYGIGAPGQFSRWGLVMSNDSDLIDSVTGEILLDAPGTIEAYQWMGDLVYKHKVASPDGVTTEDMATDTFGLGKVGILFGSTGNYGGLQKALGDNLITLPMPCNKVCRVPVGGAGIGILASSSTEEQDAAYKFISYAASPEANAAWFKATGYMPINKKTADQQDAKDALANLPGIDTAIKQLDFAKGRPRPPVVTWMRSSEYPVWQQIALNGADAETVLKDFAERTRKQAER